MGRVVFVPVPLEEDAMMMEQWKFIYNYILSKLGLFPY